MALGRTPRRRRTGPGATAVADRRVDALPANGGAPQHPATPRRIATSLEEDIVLGRRHPRERLVEQDLCERFQTHRGDVRLALFELEQKGIVQRIPNRGAIVRDLTPREVTEIYAVREELEVMATRILPLPVAESELARLGEIQQRHSAAIDNDDMLAVFYANLNFHEAVFELCGNACLIETIRQLEAKVYGIRFYANAFTEALDRARRDHLDIIDALRGGRRGDLIELTRQHLKPSPQAYIRAYERRFGNAGRE
ncbi:MAG: GntR family transcriptional regulator [Alphaproteobacteria bacterium]|nr:GntR family transcriptional regulator [Alphaproteobacteria bacterium]